MNGALGTCFALATSSAIEADTVGAAATAATAAAAPAAAEAAEAAAAAPPRVTVSPCEVGDDAGESGEEQCFERN